ncbi:MAG: cell division protein FtsQ/DivIB [Methylococcales bacterium]|nr:cell division protein FtsQ/DivIB [Methylococcales bacterium]
MKNRAIRLFVGLSLIAGVSYTGWKEVKKQGANWLPIYDVSIGGVFQYTKESEIQGALEGLVNEGIYNADIQAIRQSVTVLPWVKSAIVKRVWPDMIDIKIIEQQAVARWKSTDLMNEAGELFRPDNVGDFEQLPRLSGSEGSAKDVLEIMKGLAVTLSEKRLVLAEFDMSDRRAWTVKLQRGIELKLGREEQLKKLQRFLTTLRLIGEAQIEKITVVDLRYPNGYSLAWKQAEAKIDWKLIADKSREAAY